ncbi:MAG TPA: hypothetical protein VNV61_08610 [Steroidobacteraceae bacterium]|jgi:hypothetical protein|nr:hypothetical protein [Steroidobacteraceae bacterium]
MNHERFKNVADGVQSIVLSFAVIVGGVWSAYTFGVLEKVDEAKANLESLTAPSLSINIETQQTASPAEKKYGLIIHVKIQNTGGKDIFLNLTQPDPQHAPLKVTLVETADNGLLVAKRSYSPVYYRDISSRELDVMAGQNVQLKSTKQITYFVQLDAPGIYFVRFSAPHTLPVKDAQGLTPEYIEKTEGAPFSGETWLAQTFVEVR